jgi:hypothetical protein
MKNRGPKKRPASPSSVKSTTCQFLLFFFGVGFFCAVLAGGLALSEYRYNNAPADRRVKVYRQHGCHCAFAWGKAIEAEGFVVSQIEVDDLASIRRYLHTPASFSGCHVAEIGPYFLEGHVPAIVIKQLMLEKIPAYGVAVLEKRSASAPGDDIVVLDRRDGMHRWEERGSNSAVRF